MLDITPKTIEQDIEFSVKDMEDDWGGVSQGFIVLPDGRTAEVQIIVQADPNKFINVTLLNH